MNRMPDWLKWLVILFVFIVLAGLMLAVNDRASRVDMPEPDNTFGIYRSSSESEAGSSHKSKGPAVFCGRAFLSICQLFRTILPSSASTVRLPPEASRPSTIRLAASSSTCLRMILRRSRAPNLPPSHRATRALMAAGV